MRKNVEIEAFVTGKNQMLKIVRIRVQNNYGGGKILVKIGWN